MGQFIILQYSGMRGIPGVVHAIQGYPMKWKTKTARGDDLFYCVLRERKEKCKASVAINSITQEIRILNEHRGHEQDDVFLETEIARAEIRAMARDKPLLNPKEIISRVLSTVSPAAAEAAGNNNALRKLIQRTRTSQKEKKGNEEDWESSDEKEVVEVFKKPKLATETISHPATWADTQCHLKSLRRHVYKQKRRPIPPTRRVTVMTPFLEESEPSTGIDANAMVALNDLIYENEPSTSEQSSDLSDIFQLVGPMKETVEIVAGPTAESPSASGEEKTPIVKEEEPEIVEDDYPISETTPRRLRCVPNPVHAIHGFPMKWKTRTKAGDDIFHCVLRDRKQQCKASVAIHHTTKKIRVLKPHMGHKQDDVLLETELARSDIREIARKNPSLNPKEVISQVQNGLSAESAAAMGSYAALRKMVYCNRKRPSDDEQPTRQEMITGKKEIAIVPTPPTKSRHILEPHPRKITSYRAAITDPGDFHPDTTPKSLEDVLRPSLVSLTKLPQPPRRFLVSKMPETGRFKVLTQKPKVQPPRNNGNDLIIVKDEPSASKSITPTSFSELCDRLGVQD